jgi:HEAT repeat protein
MLGPVDAGNQPPPPPADLAPEQAAAAPPYRNLFVPLVVVPFLVVGVLVLVFLFFGAIRGQEAGLERNLDAMLHGGTNERQQAALNLSVQLVENREAREQAREEPWATEADFLGRLEAAWQEMEGEENQYLRLTLAMALLEYGDRGARAKVESFLALTDEQDPDAQVRWIALRELGRLGGASSAPAVIPFLGHPDGLLRQGAAAALQTMPGEASVQALQGVLGDPSLELRGMAAISLSHHGDASGAHVLADLASLSTYEAAHAEDPRKYADARLVQNSRIYAIQALARLARPEDRGLLQGLAEDDSDPAVREAAMLALRGGSER